MATTIKPVTASGWYEHTDGTVGRYTWRAGRLKLDETVADWSLTLTEAERVARDAREQFAARGETADERSERRAGC